MLERLEELNKELAKARRLMLKEEITAAEYREIREEYQPEINSLEVRISNFPVQRNKIDDIVNKAIDNISRLDSLFEKERLSKNVKSCVRYTPKN